MAGAGDAAGLALGAGAAAVVLVTWRIARVRLRAAPPRFVREVPGKDSKTPLWALQDQVLAVDYLQKAVEIGYLNSEYLTLSPLFASLKQQPAFNQLLDRINQNREQQRQQFLAAYPAPDL